MYFHLLSDCILIFTVGFVIVKCFGLINVSERIFWSFFLLTTLLVPITEILQVMNMGKWQQIQQFLEHLKAVAGGIGLIAGSWCLVTLSDFKPIVSIGVMMVALVLFVAVINFQAGIMAIIILPFCIIFVLVIACWGLLRRRRSALWLVFAMMFLSLSLKKMYLPIGMEQIEIQHYLTTLSVLFIGYAIQNKYVILFR